MTASLNAIARSIRQTQWDHFEGRLTYAQRERRIDRLWDRAFAIGGREGVQAVQRRLDDEKAATVTA